MSAGFGIDIERETQANVDFRKVIFTGPHAQIVLMSLKPGEAIGMEVHHGLDQFIRVDGGGGRAIIGGNEFPLNDGDAVVVPEDTRHNVIASEKGMKLYTIYTSKNHEKGETDLTKEDAERREKKTMTKGERVTMAKPVYVFRPSEYVVVEKALRLQKSEMPKKGTALHTKKEWRTAHRTPPKEYGDVKYADPAGHRYPIDTPEHVRAALRYFGKKKNYSMYPPTKRKEMLARMHRAAKKFGIS